MPTIKVIRAAETIDGDPTPHWHALMGCTVEADGRSIDVLLRGDWEIQDPLAPDSKHYRVAIVDVLESLTLSGSNHSAVTYWGRSLENTPPILLIPHDCAEIVSQTTIEEN